MLDIVSGTEEAQIRVGYYHLAPGAGSASQAPSTYFATLELPTCLCPPLEGRH